MRNTCFRGKRKYCGKYEGKGDWVKGFYTDMYGCPRIERPSGNEYGNPVDYIDVLGETVGEFTGLTDKNRKEVFEDDVLKYELYKNGKLHAAVYVLVYWDKKNAAFKLQCSEDVCAADMEGVGDCEIIGNIHDNPELLKHFKEVTE